MTYLLCYVPRDEDLKKLQELRDSTLTKLVVPTTKIPDEMLGALIGLDHVKHH